jgi:hypothetical protein
MGVEMNIKRHTVTATVFLAFSFWISFQLVPAQGATGVGGFPLKYRGAFNCGNGVVVFLRPGYRFRSGPGTGYRIIENNFDRIRYDTRVIARVGDWLDLNGSIDIWVNIRDVYVDNDPSWGFDFDLSDRCLSGVRVR